MFSAVLVKSDTPSMAGVIFPREGLERAVKKYNKDNTDSEMVITDDGTVTVVIKESHPMYKNLKGK